jgi:putative toxin-antitoxin system antitoxin component (TIGR02293 family)
VYFWVQMSGMGNSTKNSLIVEEPAMAYGYANFTPLGVMMGGFKEIPSDFDLVNLARTGISKKSILALAKKISLTLEEISNVLHISERTLQRYTPSTLVKIEYADKAIELARLYERGAAVLGSENEFNVWMRTPNHALNNEIPLNLLDTSIGFDLILQVLGRIEYGVFS